MIYSKINKLYKSRGISISRLEKETGLGNATVRRWKTSSPTVDKLKLVSDYFGISIDELLKPEQNRDIDKSCGLGQNSKL